MAFVNRLLPAAAPPAPLARWRRALAVTQAVGLASLGVFLPSAAAMVVRILSDGKYTVFRAAPTVFYVSMLFGAMVGSVYDLLRIIVERSEANGQEAVTLKSLGVVVVIFRLVPAACSFVLIISTLLELSSPKGSLMETISIVLMYVAVGVLVLFGWVAIVAQAVLLCWMMAIGAKAIWECCRPAAQLRENLEEKGL